MKRIGKKIGKLIGIFAVTLLLGIFIFAGKADAKEDLFYYGRYALSQMDDAEDLLFAYDALEAGFEANAERIYISDNSHDISVSQCSTVYAFFTDDHPEYFWLAGGYSYYTTGYDKVGSVLPNCSMTGTELENAKKAFTAVGDSLIAGLEGKSEYEKSFILHNRLAYLVTYEFSQNNQNAYGALVEEACVCAGYAHSYQYLLNRVGISAWVVTGYATNSEGNTERHAWNLVRIDGKWYYTDVTWDDQGEVEEDIYYSYFNITEAQIEKNHYPDDVYDGILPNATSTEANFFYKEGRVMTSFDVTKAATLLKADGGSTRILVDGDVDAFIDAFYANCRSVAQEMGINGGYRYGYSRSGNQVVLILEWQEQEDVEHTFSALTKMVAPSCGTAGMQAYYTCTTCNQKFNLDKEMVSDQDLVIPSNVTHNFVEVIDKEATTEETGLKHEACTNCGEKRGEGTVIEKLPSPEPEPEPTHTYGSLIARKEATCGKDGMDAHYKCPDCDKYFDSNKKEVTYASLILPATGNHNFIEVIDKEPTTEETGLKHEACTNCGEKRGEGTVIEKLPKPEPTPQPQPTPKPQPKPTPKPVVKAPKGTTLSSLKAGKKKITVKWKKQTKDTTGYEVQYTTDKKFKKSIKTKVVKKAKTTSLTISKLKSKKTYYVRIRTYKVVKGKKYYSTWCKKALKVKVK